MGDTMEFNRCVYCFAPRTQPGTCGKCGYDHGLCDLPGWMLPPGSLLKGRYMVGKNRGITDHQLSYLGWDLERQETVDIVEYFPRELVTRDITHSPQVVTIPGRESQMESGRQQFLDRVKTFCSCVSRMEENLMLDVFQRNDTCYYVIKRYKPKE